MKTNIPLPEAVPVIQLEKIDAVLRADAERHVLFAGCWLDRADDVPNNATAASCQSVGRCANASLLLAAGFPVAKLKRIYRSDIRDEANKLLGRRYGLQRKHVDAVISTNDDTFDPDNNGTRYEEVMGLLTFADVMQSQGFRFEDDYDISRGYLLGRFREEEA